jgi:hypothetical protein
MLSLYWVLLGCGLRNDRTGRPYTILPIGPYGDSAAGRKPLVGIRASNISEYLNTSAGLQGREGTLLDYGL